MFRPARFLTLLLLLSSSTLAGENVSRPGVLHLNLEKALQMALARDFSIQVEQYAPRAARELVAGQWGRFDPVIGASYTRGETLQRSLFRSGVHTPIPETTQTDSFSAGIEGTTPTGASYRLGLDTTGLGGTPGSLSDENRAVGSLGLTVPLLRGAGFAANLSGVRIARTELEISEWQLRQRIIDVMTETNFVYHELHFAKENLLVAIRSRELAKQLVANNQSRVAIGVMSPLDVIPARADAAQREEAVILAERTVRDNENLLKQLVTNDMASMLTVRVEIEPPRTLHFQANVSGGIEDALALRPDYRQSILDLQRRNITLAFTKNEMLPRFDLTGSLRLLGVENDFGGSVGRLTQRDETTWQVGAVVSLPIPNRTARANRNVAQLRVAQALVDLQRLEQQIVVEVDNASGQITTGRQRIVSTRVARILAGESLAAGEEQLRAGKFTTFDVLQLQERLASAEVAELRAQADHNKAVGEYYRRTGTTLREHNVQLQ